MSSRIFKSPLPYLALLIAHIIWGGNFVVVKVVLNEIPSLSLAFLRFGLACILIIPFLLPLEKEFKKVNLKDLPLLLISGVFSAGLNIIFFFEGLQRTTAINASVLSLIVPVLSVLTAWWFLKEKVFWINLWGIFFGLMGAISIIGIPLFLVGINNPKGLIGDGLILLSALSSVVGALILKKLLQKYHPIVITAATFFVATIIFVVPAILEYLKNPYWLGNVTIIGFLGLLYITVLSTVSAYFLMMWGLKRIPLTQANLFQYLEPAIAATLAVPILGERISFSFIIGTCLVVLGVFWGTLGKEQHHHLEHRQHRN